MMKYFILTLFSILQLFSFENDDIVIKENNERVLRFEYFPKFENSIFVEIGNQKFEIQNIKNAVSSNFGSGFPYFLERKLMIGIPSFEIPNIKILNIEYEEINSNLISIPNYENGIPNYNINFFEREFFPKNIFEFSDIEKSECFFSHLKIFPYQYDIKKQVLRKYSKIEIEITFSKPQQKFSNIILSKNLKEKLLNYNIAKNWSHKKKNNTRFNSVLANGNWFKFEIVEEGIYKIFGSTISQIGIPRNSVSTIKIFGNGGFQIPDFPNEVNDYGDLKENAIYVFDENNNGNFEDNDYILFFGKSVNSWQYDSTRKKFSHQLHNYATKNIYFLTYGVNFGKRMQIENNIQNGLVQNEVQGKIFYESEKINVQQSGKQMFGEILNSGNEINLNLSLPSLSIQKPIQYNFSVAARANSNSTFEFYEHNQLILTSIANSVNTAYEYGIFCNFALPNSTIQSPNFNNNNEESNLKIKFLSNDLGTGYINWIEIFYTQNLKAKNNYFQFHTLDTNEILQYGIENFTDTEIFVFNVTDFENVKLVNSSKVQDKIILKTFPQNFPNEIIVVGKNSFKTVLNFESLENQNLHGENYGTRFFIVSPSEFLSEANRLKSYRENSVKRKLKTSVVTLEEIYNEFSGGVKDIAAIRNFGKYLYETDSTFNYLLLFGDGNYDYKNILTSEKNYIPAWETYDSFGTPLNSYSSDDFFGAYTTYLDVDIAVGRFCVNSIYEAKNIVDKIIEYESNANNDGWNSKSIFISDDFHEEGNLHNRQTEEIAEFFVPYFFEKIKIYPAEFPTEITSLGRRKPTVNSTLVSEWNKGSLLINYIGHGNPRVWTHEQIFTRENTIPLLNNVGKYPILIAATCNFAQFDNIGTQSSAEILLNKEQSGVIGVFAATRPVFSFPNVQLNEWIYTKLFETDEIGKIFPKRIGDVIKKAKQIMSFDDNQNRFYLLGDPTLEIQIPEKLITVDSINGNQISTENIILKSLLKTNVASSIKNGIGNTDLNFNGNAILTLHDAFENKTISEDGSSFTYKKNGSTLFKGNVSFESGKQNSQFIIPKDISYDTTRNALISIFSFNDTSTGIGGTNKIKIGGTDSLASIDIIGPEISVYLNAKNFRDGDLVNESPKLILELFDSSGINTSTSGIGHNLEAKLDDEFQSIDLSNYYRSELNDYRIGKIEYQFSDLSDGTHNLFIRVWDTYNNPSEKNISFKVATSEKFSLENIYNYPNPFSDKTHFIIEHNQTIPIDVEIKIYTINGRLIQKIEEKNLENSYSKIFWNGRDFDGNEIANGLYIYKIIAKTIDGKFLAEKIEKLSIIK